jgi:predicted ATPase
VEVLAKLAAAGPLVVVIDDLHDADADAIEMVCASLRPDAVSPALFLITTETQPAPTVGRVLDLLATERPDASRIDLSPLDTATGAELVDHLLAGASVAAATRDAIVAKAAGNPLFAGEAVRLLADDPAMDVAQLPDTVEAVIGVRLDRLPDEARVALEAAAAIGPDFWVPVLAWVLGNNELGEILPALADAGLIVPGDEQEWSFRHPLFQTVARAATSGARRAELARRVGAAIELSETARRRATALFADVQGFASLAEQVGEREAYEIVGACLRLLDAIVVKHGGHVEKHLGDCVIAVFGAPVAIENAPRAAVNAALEMRKAVRAYGQQRGVAQPLQVHSGVNTGSVIADPRTSAGTSDLPVFGDDVNIASRLKDKAPAGEIWVGPETFRATRDDFEYRALDPLALKGKREAVAVYALLSSDAKLHRRRVGTGAISSPLVGRETELAQIRDRLAMLARGESGVVTLRADAGLGKSRFLGEVQALPEAQAARWLEGRSISTGRGQHHHPFVDLLRGWAKIGADETGAYEKLAGAVTALLGDEAAAVLPFLATLMNVPLDDADRRRVQAVQDEARARLLERAVVRVFAKLASERPLVLVFDDLHWADGSSIELLCELLRPGVVSPVLFLLATRPHHADTSGRVLAFLAEARPDVTHLDLLPLAADAAAQLLDNLFRDGHVPLASRESILAEVGGNPFFAEEVVRALVETGVIEVRGGRLFATERIHTAVIPGSVEETIQARLDRLPADRRRVLETAAVIGPTFWSPVLAEVLGKETLDETLRALADTGLVVEGDAQAWSFQHPLVQEVAYGTTLRARREDLHRRVGEALESWLTDRVPGYHAMLAFHFGRGRDLERAEAYLFRAGADAAGSAASNEALDFFREAAALYFQLHGDGGDPAKKAQLEKNLGMALMNRGQLAEAVESFGKALAHLGDPVSRKPVELYRKLVWDLGNVAVGLHLPRRRGRIAANDVQREQIDIRFRRGLAQTTTAPGPVILADTVATLRRLERVDPQSVPEAGGIYSGAIAIFSYGGVSFALGRRILDRAREVVEGGNVRETMLYYRLMGWIHYYLSGDWSAAHDIDEALLEEGLRYGRLWEVQTFLDLDGERCLHRGDWDGAARRLDALSAFNEQFRHGTAIAAHRAITAYLHLERRELPEALAAIDRYYRDHAEASFQLQALGMMAKMHALGGDLPAAGQALARADELMQRAGEQPPFHRSRYDLARLLVDVARLDAGIDGRAAERSAVRAQRAALRGAAKVAARRPEVFRLAGTLALLRGRRRRALAMFERSVAAAEQLGMGPELARTWLEASRRGLRLRGRDAEACRAEAQRLFAAHGLEAELTTAAHS